MTPAEFTVLVDSRLMHYRETVDVMDLLNAFNCQITLGTNSVSVDELRMFKEMTKPIEEKPTEETVNVFKQWVIATGGETI